MIYFENASHGNEGFNTHVMSWTFCISFSNFLDRDFFFDFEIPCSTPPAFATLDPFKDRFKILMESERSLVTDLVIIPNRRVFEIDRAFDATELRRVGRIDDPQAREAGLGAKRLRQHLGAKTGPAHAQ